MSAIFDALEALSKIKAQKAAETAAAARAASKVSAPTERIVVAEGVRHRFPGDATDDEISAALNTLSAQSKSTGTNVENVPKNTDNSINAGAIITNNTVYDDSSQTFRRIFLKNESRRLPFSSKNPLPLYSKGIHELYLSVPKEERWVETLYANINNTVTPINITDGITYKGKDLFSMIANDVEELGLNGVIHDVRFGLWNKVVGTFLTNPKIKRAPFVITGTHDLRTVRADGLYFPTENKAVISANILDNTQFYQVAIHEGVHVVLEGPLRTSKRFKSEIESLLEVTRQNIDSPNHYGLTNSSEFVAELLSAPRFYKAVKDIKLPGKAETVLDRFTKLVAPYLGVSGIAVGSKEWIELQNLLAPPTLSSTDKNNGST